jgi:hypothetical protein
MLDKRYSPELSFGRSKVNQFSETGRLCFLNDCRSHTGISVELCEAVLMRWEITQGE